MDLAAMETISTRLASVESLYFPGAFRQSSPGASADRRAALRDLLARDAPLFLERYGSVMNPAELLAFDPLAADYEVRWHLDRLRRAEEPAARAAAVRNRRRAYLERLVEAGDYFSEDSMRGREPYLHHEYLGKFQDPASRGLVRPGERWSEALMRQLDEVGIMEKIRGEQQKLGVPEAEWVGICGGSSLLVEDGEEIEEEEEGEEEEEEEGTEEKIEATVEEEEPKQSRDQQEHISDHNSAQFTTDDPHGNELSAEEMQEQLEQFTHIMQQKFLTGEDSEYLDYSKIDNDEGLDDHWLKEANYDAEEKYFDED